MKKRKWGFAGRGSISPRNHSALSKKGGQARAKKLSRRKLSAIGRKGGRPGTVRARAKQLGIKIPRGASRQYASKLVKLAEQELNEILHGGGPHELAMRKRLKAVRGQSPIKAALKLFKNAEARLKKEDPRAWALIYGPGVATPTGILLEAMRKKKLRTHAHK